MDKQTEMISLNDDLLTDFMVKGLEERLETDPLMLSGLFMDGGIQTADCFCNPISGGDFCSPIIEL